MFFGEVYKITNKINDTSYVGQAVKYMGKFDKPWGTTERWKSHISDAFSSKKDHCALLNNAIRKYGAENFLVEKLMDCCDQEDMDNKEKELIKQYNTLTPNGYNLNEGGRSGKDSDETREKKRQMRLGTTHTEIIKKNISLGQLGNRRKKKTRKIKEDNDLPKYINCRRTKSGKKISYCIDRFPIGTKEKKYISQSFHIGNCEPKEVLKKAISYLNNLKKEYSHIQKEITVNKLEHAKSKPAIIKATEIQLKDLPPFIYPVHHSISKHKIGYYVEGVPDNNGNPHPKKIFTSDKANMWDLNDAKNYVLECEIKNKDGLFNVPDLDSDFKKSRKRKYQEDGENLPKYVSVLRQYGNKIGYNICIPSLIKENGKKYTKKFANKKLSMEEKLSKCIETLRELKKKHNIVN